MNELAVLITLVIVAVVLKVLLINKYNSIKATSTEDSEIKASVDQAELESMTVKEIKEELKANGNTTRLPTRKAGLVELAVTVRNP
tara:strand:- start:11599 stop:11856 length:258 start_codon:yes stop_codon:yes gene_type:complete